MTARRPNRRFSAESTAETCHEELCAVYHGRVAHADSADGRTDVTCCPEILRRGSCQEMVLTVGGMLQLGRCVDMVADCRWSGKAR